MLRTLSQGCSLIRAYDLICSLHLNSDFNVSPQQTPSTYVREAELESLHTADSSTALLEERWRQQTAVRRAHRESAPQTD